jgi:hypothetical protein
MAQALMADRRLMDRIRAEFEELPGLSITCEQARRLFGLGGDEPSLCRTLLDALVRDGSLERTKDRQYCLREPH